MEGSDATPAGMDEYQSEMYESDQKLKKKSDKDAQKQAEKEQRAAKLAEPIGPIPPTDPKEWENKPRFVYTEKWMVVDADRQVQNNITTVKFDSFRPNTVFLVLGQVSGWAALQGDRGGELACRGGRQRGKSGLQVHQEHQHL